MTPIGAGLQNIAIALFAGRNQPDKSALQSSQAGMYDAHGELYREQAAKAIAERKLAERLLSARSDDSIDSLRATEAGVPVHTLRGIDASLRGEQDLTGYSPAQIAGHRRATLAVRPAYADKTTSALDISKAINAYREREDLEAVRGAPGDPTRTAQAYFSTSGKAPFDNMGGMGTFNQATGAQTLNDFGTARVQSERALATERGAHAGLHTARRDQITSGADAPMVPVVKKDAMGNDMVGSDGKAIVELVPRPQAVGRTPAAQPREFAPPKPTTPKPVTVDERRVIAEVQRQLGVIVDKAGKPQEGSALPLTGQAQGALVARAVALSKENGGNIPSAVAQAVEETGELEDDTKPGTFYGRNPTGFRKPKGQPRYPIQARPAGGPVATAPAAPQPAPAPRPGATDLPATARARLREGVQTTFGNGQVWTLTDGVPTRVR